MRLTDQIQKWARRGEALEALPPERLTIDYETHFRFMPPEGLKRRLMRMAAPTALAMLQPIIRRRVRRELEIPADYWSYMDLLVTGIKVLLKKKNTNVVGG